MNLFDEAQEALEAAENAVSFPNGLPSSELRVQIAQVKALLSISQELSRIRDMGINPGFVQ